MKLKAIYEDETEIPSAYKDLYILRGGKWVIDGIEGMKTDADVHRVKSALEAEQQAHKATKDKYAVLGDKDPIDILKQLDQVDELSILAEKGKGDEEKLNSLVEARVNTIKAQNERVVNQLQEKLNNLEKENQTFKEQIRTETLHKQITEAAKKAGVREINIEDAVLYCERYLDIAPDGSVVTKEAAGITPGLDAETFVKELRGKRGWWDNDVSGGLNGGKVGFGGSGNPWSEKSWNLTEQGRILRENPKQAEMLANAAGKKLAGDSPSL